MLEGGPERGREARRRRDFQRRQQRLPGVDVDAARELPLREVRQAEAEEVRQDALERQEAVEGQRLRGLRRRREAVVREARHHHRLQRQNQHRAQPEARPRSELATVSLEGKRTTARVNSTRTSCSRQSPRRTTFNNTLTSCRLHPAPSPRACGAAPRALSHPP